MGSSDSAFKGMRSSLEAFLRGRVGLKKPRIGPATRDEDRADLDDVLGGRLFVQSPPSAETLRVRPPRCRARMESALQAPRICGRFRGTRATT
jgi:hypothetical protein